jgi:hypothetical protein
MLTKIMEEIQPVLTCTSLSDTFLNHIQDFGRSLSNPERLLAFIKKIKTFSYNKKDLASGIESNLI